MTTLYNTANQYDSEITYYGATASDTPVIKVEMDLSSSFPTEVLDIDYGGVLAYNTKTAYDNEDRYDGFVVFDDITSDVRGIEISRGKDPGSQVYEHFDAGTCGLDLADRVSKYLPNEPLSPYYPNVTPLRQVRVSATWSGVTAVLFRGFVDRWDISWQPKQQYAEVRTTSTDATKLLANFDTIYQGVDNDPAWSRVQAMLNDKAWPADFTDVEQGTWTTTGTRTNLCPNPSFETNNTSWSTGQSGGVTRSTTYGFSGTASGLVTMSSTTDSNTFSLPAGTISYPTIGSYTASAYIYIPEDSSLVGRTITISFEGGTQANTGGTSQPATLVGGSWVRASYTARDFTGTTGTSPALVFRLSGTLSSAVGQTIYIDGCLIEYSTTLSNYFDGSAYTVPAPTVGATTAWTGTAHGSTSVATEYSEIYFARLVQDVATRRPLLPNLQEYEFTEQGALFVSKEGRVTWRNIDTANPETTDDPVYVFSDTGASGYVPVTEILFGISDDTVYNTVSITPTLGTEQSTSDPDSIDTYRERALIKTDVPLMTDAAGNDLARFLVQKQASPISRIESVSTDPRTSVHAAGVALTIDLLAPVNIIRTPPAGTSATYEMFVSGIRHQITPDSWTTTFVTSYRNQGFLLSGPNDIVIP